MAVVEVPPDELAASSAPLALVFERLTGLSLQTMSINAVNETLRGGVGAILTLALAVPLSGLADLTARFTLVIYALVNITVIRIKSRDGSVPHDVFVCPRRVPDAGLTSGIGLLLLDLVLR